MLLSALVVALCLYFVHSGHGYTIPTPEIIAYKPRGFTVSIPDESGIRLFAFHGNINKLIRSLHPGDHAKEVTLPTNGKWIFHDHQAKLKVGDTIHYWLYVLKGSLGYRYQDRSFTVTELVPTVSTNDVGSTTQHNDKEFCHNQINTLCLQSLFNITQSFTQMQTYTEMIQRKNDRMKNYIEQSPSARKLTLSGKIPPDGPASSTVSFVLRERLDMNPIIVTAQRHFDGSITFEVPTIDDKLDILDAAKVKLVSTKIVIQ